MIAQIALIAQIAQIALIALIAQIALIKRFASRFLSCLHQNFLINGVGAQGGRRRRWAGALFALNVRLLDAGGWGLGGIRGGVGAL
ncbi:hypothetical protein ABZ738_14555 [Micromonospora sp. NPDC047793]|uniref:hypothetical protein n=1 Tax=Micromonospora sp. NPDC047793 TaxID=3154342 RepID=UPI00340BD3A7